MAEARELEWLVYRYPVRHPVAESLRNDRGVVGEPRSDIPVPEAAELPLQRERQVPMEQGRERADTFGKEAIYEARVEIEAGLVDRAPPRRHHARPRYGEAVRVQAKLAGYPDVLGTARVMVAGNGGIGPVPDGSGSGNELVPYRGALAV